MSCYFVLLFVCFGAYGNVIVDKACEESIVPEQLSEYEVVNKQPGLKLEKHGNTYYYFGTIFKGNFIQAIQFCNYHDMQLLSIENAEENTFLYNKLNGIVGGDSAETRFWTSGTTLWRPEWVWLSTGERIVYTNWRPGQPDNTNKNEKCIEVIHHPPQMTSLLWNDDDCASSQNVICETTLTKSVSKILKNHTSANLKLIDVRAIVVN